MTYLVCLKVKSRKILTILIKSILYKIQKRYIGKKKDFFFLYKLNKISLYSSSYNFFKDFQVILLTVITTVNINNYKDNNNNNNNNNNNINNNIVLIILCEATKAINPCTTEMLSFKQSKGRNTVVSVGDDKNSSWSK